MKRLLVASGLVLGLSIGASVVVPTVAGADTTCYTGCSPTTNDGSGSGPTEPVKTTASVSQSSLAFTGADIAEMTAIGVGAVGVGGVLVLRTRRRRLTN